MQRILFAFSLILSLASCATTSGLNATSTQSSFDGSKSIDITPHGMSCKNTGIYCGMLGFRWDDKHPNTAFIRTQVIDMAGTMLVGGKFVNIYKLRFNVDGNITDLQPIGDGFTKHDYDTIIGRTSNQAFAVPVDFLRTLHSSQNVKVQLVTDKGNFNDYLITNGKDTKAYNALGRFLTAYDNK